LSGAGDVVRRDWEGAAVNGLGVAAAIDGATRAPEERFLGVPRTPAPRALNDASQVADALYGYRQADRCEGEARRAVQEAEEALRRARVQGDPVVIRQAEQKLQEARGRAEGALMGAIGAGDSLQRTASYLGAQRRLYAEEQRAVSAQRSGLALAQRLSEQLQDPGLDPARKRRAAEQLARLMLAGRRFEEAYRQAQGDPGATRAAWEQFQKVQDGILGDPVDVIRVASAGVRDFAPPPGMGSSTTPQSPPGSQRITVQEGQTLERIARIHGTSVETLLALNPAISDPDLIYAGQTLRVPIPTLVIGPPDLSPSSAEAGGPTAPQEPADAPAPRAAPKEGLESVLEGAMLGDFSDNTTWSKVAGQALGGALPVLGQISDLRDTLAALDKVRKGEQGGWSDLFFATVGWLPVAGDAVKGIARGGRKAATEAAEAAGEDLVKEAAENLLKRSEGMQGVLPESGFTGRLRQIAVTLPGVQTRTIEYVKRSEVELQGLRSAFNSGGRATFLKDLATDPAKVEALRKAGLSDADIGIMAKGNVPAGWQVHHRLPLDDGGTNDFTNLILIKTEPYHKVLTNAQGALSNGMQAGDRRMMDFPVPDGFVYPP
jgi:LysM repeat protein